MKTANICKWLIVILLQLALIFTPQNPKTLLKSYLMAHSASIIKDNKPIFTINPNNPLLAEMGILGSMELLDSMGDDLSIVNAARVSYASESPALEPRDKKLIKYLAKHKHWTPFEQNSLKLFKKF